jgi:phenylalanyl-tRNA synthetase beta chain
VPDIKINPREAADILTLLGFMNDSFEEVQYQNKKDYLLGIEVRQNRADCLSAIGLAKEIAVYCDLALKLPDIFSLPIFVSKNNLDIENKANNYVKRILAVRLKNLKNKQSPEWLKELLSFSEINPVNFLVDLSNYAMLLTGYSSHLLDADKIHGRLLWSLNNNFDEIRTLDGSCIKLNKNELIIRDDKNILALAGIIGGKVAEIEMSTTSIIAEMAIYDSLIIRKNSKSLKIRTEASNRLGKDIDPNGAEFAIKLLLSLIIKNCGGIIDSKLFDFYPQKYIPAEIEFDPSLPSVYAGINIPETKCLEILKKLGCGTKRKDNKLFITAPSNRTDILLEEDLIEEVVRIFGYKKIPSDEIPKLEVAQNITLKNIILAEKIRDILSVLGFDEILSWPLTKKGESANVNYLDWDVVSTQNSLNEDFPGLRQSMAISLENQFQEYLKKNIEYIKIFEIGKVFGKKENTYEEHEVLGILMRAFPKNNELSDMKETVEKLLRIIGFNNIFYKKSKIKPQKANLYSCWDIIIEGEALGILYKMAMEIPNQNMYFSELNITEISKLLEKIHNEPTVELTQKLVVLDANVELKKDEFIDDFLNEVRKKIKDENIWSVSVIDKFSLEEKNRYTVRIAYKELSDIEAKKIHLRVFNLE